MAASEGMSSLPPSQRLDGGLNSQLLLLQDDSLRFRCGPPQQHGDPGPKTRELSGFINDRYGQPLSQGLSEFRSDIFGDDHQLDHHQDRNNWNGGNCRTSSGDGSEEDDEELDDDDDNDRERGVDHNKNTGEAVNGDGFSFEKSKHISSFGVGTSRGMILEEGNDSINATTIANLNDDSHEQERMDQYQSTVTIAEPEGDLYYSQYLQGQEVLGGRQKDVAIENGCGFSGRGELGESLRVFFSDPVNGALMDDAMILPCGHSFGGGGVQQILRIKACYTCSQPVSEESILPNLSLRAAIQAFQREEELHVHRSSKKRRERFEQDKGNYGDSTPMDHYHHSRGRGVQFPFVVTDRVIIKGNKRTPLRFVGREAIVTTQCLNGWYVVKTLDNAESVKLQYRSLAKVSDNPSSSKPPPPPVPPKMTPNWL